jgi:hypothetical protein
MFFGNVDYEGRNFEISRQNKNSIRGNNFGKDLSTFLLHI